MSKKNNELHIGGNFDLIRKINVCNPYECEIMNDNFGCPDNCPGESYFSEEHFYISRVVYNGPATIVFWNDGTKTVAKCGENDDWNPETGLAICYLKKIVGSREVHRVFRDWLPNQDEVDNQTVVKTIHDVRKALKDGTVKND